MGVFVCSDPPVPNIDMTVTVSDEKYNTFTLTVQPEMFNNSNGPVLFYGFLITSNKSGMTSSSLQSSAHC